MRRRGVNKRRSAGGFRKRVGKTDKRNLRGPLRGGIRL